MDTTRYQSFMLTCDKCYIFQRDPYSAYIFMVPHIKVNINTALSNSFVLQWNLYSSFSSGVWKRNNGSGKTIDAGAIVEIWFAQGP
jgi:hypothetical protein